MADKNRHLLFQAIYSFQGKNNDELWFKKGDVITVTQKEDGGWWEGTLGEKTGWFPSNYVKEYQVQGDNVSSGRNTALALSPAQQKTYRDYVVRDIIDSERAHVAELQTLSTKFLQPLEALLLSPEDYHQLVSNMDEVLSCHQALLTALEECGALPTNEQRIGHIFLTSAPRLQQVHQAYCAAHPRAVCVLDKYRDELNSWMEAAGATVPGILVLTTGLSKPFRRLEKYAGMLQELERHIEEHDPDRGDTQRSVSVYKDISSACSAVRRQKELELEVVTGGVRGWEGEDLRTLGDIVHMGSVAVGPDHRDRYLVLFPNTLLMLSVSHRMSAFIYEGKLPLTGITINKLENTDNYKNAFEIVGPMIERIVAVCQTREDQQRWVDVIRQQIRAMHKSISPRSPRVETPPQLNAAAVAHANQTTSLVRSNVLNNNPTSPTTNTTAGPVNINLINKQKIINNTLQNINNINNNNNNNVKPWSVTKLRPSAPLRPESALSREDNVRRSGRGARKPSERGTGNYEEDALVLKVIEAYCTSDKMRYTVSSAVLDHPPSAKSEESSSPFCEKSINTAINTLKEQMQELQSLVSNMSCRLDRETQARRNLQNLIHSHVSKDVPMSEE